MLSQTDWVGAHKLSLLPGAGNPRYELLEVSLVFAKCFHVCCCNMILQMKMLFGIYVVVFNFVQTITKNFL